MGSVGLVGWAAYGSSASGSLGTRALRPAQHDTVRPALSVMPVRRIKQTRRLLPVAPLPVSAPFLLFLVGAAGGSGSSSSADTKKELFYLEQGYTAGLQTAHLGLAHQGQQGGRHGCPEMPGSAARSDAQVAHLHNTARSAAQFLWGHAATTWTAAPHLQCRV